MNYAVNPLPPCCTGCGDVWATESLDEDNLCPACGESLAAELAAERAAQRWDEEHGGEHEPRWAF